MAKSDKERRAMDGAMLKCATDGINILTSDLIDHRFLCGRIVILTFLSQLFNP
ncbi:hypothetical protein [Dehalobacter restrictus]|nr:hypothetical protein [Dehalobacter restrictus]